jgi:hypothetical protein
VSVYAGIRERVEVDYYVTPRSGECFETGPNTANIGLALRVNSGICT